MDIFIFIILILLVLGIAVYCFWRYAEIREEIYPNPNILGMPKSRDLPSTSAVLGTVTGWKTETHNGVTLYYPMFSYSYQNVKYNSVLEVDCTSSKYPLGTKVTLLLEPEKPEVVFTAGGHIRKDKEKWYTHEEILTRTSMIVTLVIWIIYLKFAIGF